MSIKKQIYCQTWFNRGAIVYVYFDPRKEPQGVPPFLRHLESTFFSYNPAFSNPNWVFGLDKVYGTLYFDKQPYYCAVPWSSVFTLHNSMTHDAVHDDALRPVEKPKKRRREFPSYLRLVK